MGSKTSKNRHAAWSKPAEAANPQLEVKRLIEKGWLKDAVKQAKICYRDATTPLNHRLLELAYFLRADQLLRDSMPTSAQEVARHLLDFGLTDPELFGRTARLLVSLGMVREARLLGESDSLEERERFNRLEADTAVVHPERFVGASAELREGARTIREAIAAVQSGDDAAGLAALREIARGSLFADWKLFVRGLSAHNRKDEAEARANWDRLDPDRAAVRIARGLRTLEASSASAEPGREHTRITSDALELRIFGAKVLEPLELLQEFLADDLYDAMTLLASVRRIIANIEPALAVRLTEVLVAPIFQAVHDFDYEDAEALIQDFTRAAAPLPIDPNWNRFRALAWEGPKGDLEAAQEYWVGFLNDLENHPHLKAEERPLAQRSC